MTAPQSLSERLRASIATDIYDQGKLDSLLEEAADALDAKDVEIAKLKTEGDRLSLSMMNAYCDADRKDAEIELLKEGRQLHDELVDHLEHVIAQAAAALEMFAQHYPHGINPYLDEAYGLAREALGAHRASAGEEQS